MADTGILRMRSRSLSFATTATFGLVTGLAVLSAAPGPVMAQSSTARPQPAPSVSGTPHTLTEALMLAYTTNTALLAERANVRATDENVPAALAGWRPTVTVTANAGYIDGLNHTHVPGTDTFGVPAPSTNTTSGSSRGTNAQAITLSQPLYTGGQTKAGLNQSENKVMGERSRLIDQEQTTFYNVVGAYVGSSSANSGFNSNSGVIQMEQVLALNINNEQVLARQLQATNDRFRVGEITRTDVAQAEAALAQATATRQTSEGNLATARAAFQQVVGVYPGKLIEPQPLRLPVKTLDEAQRWRRRTTPRWSRRSSMICSERRFRPAYSRLMPNVRCRRGRAGRTSRAARTDPALRRSTLNLSMPIYQGGLNTRVSATRGNATADPRAAGGRASRRGAVAVSAWDTCRREGRDRQHAGEYARQRGRVGGCAARGDRRQPHHAGRVECRAGVAERRAVGAEPGQLYHRVLWGRRAVGRLTARDLHLPVPLYDETAYYKAVKDRWVGMGDYATDQPGR